ncbi:MAG: hypothetical protein ABFQ64_10845 [Campylobacterota bacterium]
MKYGIISITILLLLSGCVEPTIQDKNENTTQAMQQTYIPPPPKKVIKLKDVNDTNFNADYMYPEDNKKQEIVKTSMQTPVASTDTMDKAQCIAMITQEKFDKYTAMFGSEDASIKRCKMIKAASL